MVVLTSEGESTIAIEASTPAAHSVGASLPSASTGPGNLLVKLDVFDGPLDLLLQLVLAQDLDITKVSLASVCEQYLAYIGLMESLDIEVASEYLVIAATLVFIKSKRLLPPPPPPFVDELAEEAAAAENALRERLLAYQYFKISGSDLRARFEENRAYYVRTGASAEEIVQRYRLQPVSLAAAFVQALNSAATRPMVIKRETFSVVVKMSYLMRTLKQGGSVQFFALVADCEPLEVVVTFLAVLELVRARKIVFTQPAAFGDIMLQRAPKESAFTLAQSA